MWNKEKYRTVCLTTENFQKLASLGTVPDSLNTIVGRLLDRYYEQELRRKKIAEGAALT
jgi:hypothetical protein